MSANCPVFFQHTIPSRQSDASRWRAVEALDLGPGLAIDHPDVGRARYPRMKFWDFSGGYIGYRQDGLVSRRTVRSSTNIDWL